MYYVECLKFLYVTTVSLKLNEDENRKWFKNFLYKVIWDMKKLLLGFYWMKKWCGTWNTIENKTTCIWKY